MSGGPTPDAALGLSPARVKLLQRLWSWWHSPQGPWAELDWSDAKPLPAGFLDLIERGWIKAGRGRCGPLGLYTGTWVVKLTDEGVVVGKLLGFDHGTK